MRYRDAGVDIDAATRAKSEIRKIVRRTFNGRVLKDVGAFGGFFSLEGLAPDSVLVASMDGVGTKLKIAFELGGHAGVGRDLVNHCVNDIAVHGAEPLFFLDYVASGKLRPGVVREIVTGLAGACKQAGCALIGGETAEMPGFYPAHEYDLAGCIVGAVSRDRMIDGRGIRLGDLIFGLPSLGLHTNGYSLARRVLLEKAKMKLGAWVAELGRTLGEELLAPHRSYLRALKPLLAEGWLKGLAHVTGGGITENLPRILPKGCGAEILLGSWPVLPVFELIARTGEVPEEEMLRTFNMGIGMLLVVAEKDAESVTAALRKRREKFYRVGRVRRGRGIVRYARAGAHGDDRA
ncbi:MAG TPA: phosphoribosylformylglycinamidine cyclo-ligase [Terriglobia bacterium]|nr:phosphoribosylformylglycinamidine cyclo-ligase [Terriglobia bacterium]